MVKKLLPSIQTRNIIYVNEFIYAGIKIVCDKIAIFQRNQNI